MGGNLKDPSYRDVCTDKTGHVEVVQVNFDPKTVTYKQLLKVFWKIHDPTTPNRQGPDVGSQYRSVIFYHNKKQELETVQSKKEAQKKLSVKIVTEIKKAAKFYKAEDYHQQYFQRRQGCHI